jgi:hypothetical protein
MGRREDRVSSRGLIDICSGVEHSQSERERERTERPVCVIILYTMHFYIYVYVRRAAACPRIYSNTIRYIIRPFCNTKKERRAATKLLLPDFSGNVYTPY